MSKSQKAAIKAGEDTYVWIGLVVCGICGHKQKSSIEIPVEWDKPLIPLECAECESMACSAPGNY
jgi:hypothetical protein